jgi:hypothetical protein
MQDQRQTDIRLRAGSDRLESSLTMTGPTPTTLLSFGKLRKASEKFGQAFQIVPKTINFLPIHSKNYTWKPRFLKGLGPNLSAERAENFSVTPRSAVQGR